MRLTMNLRRGENFDSYQRGGGGELQGLMAGGKGGSRQAEKRRGAGVERTGIAPLSFRQQEKRPPRAN